MSSDGKNRDASEAKERRVDEVVAEYCDASDRGERVTPEEVMARHPQLRAELEEFFCAMDEFGDAARRLPSPGGVASTRTEPEQSSDAEPWRRLGRYELLDEIGRGGMGVVYRARQADLGRTVAVKVIRSGQFASSDDVQRFRLEAETAAGLDHPNIVPVYEVGQSRGEHYLAMRWMPGGNLAERVGRYAGRPRETAQLVETLAVALEHAHRQGIVHRDLKPANVFFDERDVPRLGDFGLVKRLGTESDLTQTGAILGTASYMAPEQVSPQLGPVGARSDVYSLGAVLYELLTGRAPLEAADSFDTLRRVVSEDPVAPSTIDSRVPRDLESVCLKCLEKSPANRYESAAAVGRELRRYLEGKPVAARRVTSVERAWRWCRRNPAPTAALVLLCCLVAAVTIALALLGRAYERSRARLRESYVAQARAYQRSDDPEGRTRAIGAIRSAARIRPSAALRDEAISALALASTQPDGRIDFADVTDVAFARNLDRVASADRDGNVALRSIEGSELVGAPTVIRVFEPGQAAKFLRFSPRGRFLAVAGQTGSLRVLDVSERKVVLETRASLGLFRAAADFSAAIDRFAAASTGTVWLFELASLTESDLVLSVKSEPDTLRFAPSGLRLAVSFGDRTVELIDLEEDDRERPRSTVVQFPEPVRDLAWQPGGRLLAAASFKKIFLWDVRRERLERTLEGHDGTVASIAFQPGSTVIASSGWDDTLRLWDAETGREILRRYGVSSNDILFHTDGRRLAGVVGEGPFTVYSWSVVTGRELVTFPDTEHGDTTADGRLLLRVADGEIQFFDARDGQLVTSSPTALRDLRISSRGDALLGDVRGRLVIYPLETSIEDGQSVLTVSPPRCLFSMKRLRTIDPSPDGLACGAIIGRHFGLVVSNTRPERVLGLVEHPGLDSMAISPGARWLATGTWRGKNVEVWELGSGKRLATIASGYARVAFDSTSRYLALNTQTYYGVWSTGDWKELWRRRREHPGSAGYLGFDRGGGILALAPDPRTVELIEPGSGVVLARVRGPYSETIEEIWFDGAGALWVRRSSHVERWGLPLIREHLSSLGIDWSPPSRDARTTTGAETVRVEWPDEGSPDAESPEAISSAALRNAYDVYRRMHPAATPTGQDR